MARVDNWLWDLFSGLINADPIVLYFEVMSTLMHNLHFELEIACVRGHAYVISLYRNMIWLEVAFRLTLLEDAAVPSAFSCGLPVVFFGGITDLKIWKPLSQF